MNWNFTTVTGVYNLLWQISAARLRAIAHDNCYWIQFGDFVCLFQPLQPVTHTLCPHACWSYLVVRGLLSKEKVQAAQQRLRELTHGLDGKRDLIKEIESLPACERIISVGLDPKVSQYSIPRSASANLEVAFLILSNRSAIMRWSGNRLLQAQRSQAIRSERYRILSKLMTFSGRFVWTSAWLAVGRVDEDVLRGACAGTCGGWNLPGQTAQVISFVVPAGTFSCMCARYSDRMWSSTGTLS